MKNYRAGLPFILVTVFVDTLGIGLIIPVLPTLLKEFTSSPAQQAYYFGLLGSLYQLMQFFFASVLGALSDHYGRRKVLLVSLLGGAIDYFLFALSPTLIWLLIARVIAGITGANLTVAYAYVADVSPPAKRAQRFGLLTAVGGVGYVMGPGIGGTLAALNPQMLDPRLPFYFAGGLALLNCLYGFFLLPESLEPDKRSKEPMSWRKLNPFTNIASLRRYPIVAGLIVAVALITLSFQIMTNTAVLYMERRFEWGPREIGFIIGGLGVLVAAVQVGLIRVLLRWLGERVTVILGALFGMVAYVLFGLANRGWMVVPVGLALGLASVAEPAARGLLSKEVGEHEQGTVMGAINSLTALTGAIAPILGSAVFAQVTTVGRYSPWLGAPFFLSAVLTLIGLALIIVSFSKHKEIKEKVPLEGHD